MLKANEKIVIIKLYAEFIFLGTKLTDLECSLEKIRLKQNQSKIIELVEKIQLLYLAVQDWYYILSENQPALNNLEIESIFLINQDEFDYNLVNLENYVLEFDFELALNSFIGFKNELISVRNLLEEEKFNTTLISEIEGLILDLNKSIHLVRDFI